MRWASARIFSPMFNATMESVSESMAVDVPFSTEMSALRRVFSSPRMFSRRPSLPFRPLIFSRWRFRISCCLDRVWYKTSKLGTCILRRELARLASWMADHCASSCLFTICNWFSLIAKLFCRLASWRRLDWDMACVSWNWFGLGCLKMPFLLLASATIANASFNPNRNACTSDVSDSVLSVA